MTTTSQPLHNRFLEHKRHFKMDITKNKMDIIAPILQIRKNEPETKKQNCKHKLVLLVNHISKLSKKTLWKHKQQVCEKAVRSLEMSVNNFYLF